jgi:predicted benzoate:H+ symporter BenE
LVAVPLSAAEQLNLADGHVTARVMAIYTLPCAVGMVLTLSFRQPLLLTGNIFVLIFIVSLQGRVTFAELAGASMVAGAAVVAITALGLAEHLAQLIPEPVVVGLLAGSTLPFVAGIFTVMGSEPAVIGVAFLAFVAFAVAVADLSMLGLGPYFWALVLSVGVSWTLEHEAITELRAQARERNRSTARRETGDAWKGRRFDPCWPGRLE